MRSIGPEEGNLALGGRHLSNLQRLRTSKNIRPLQTNTQAIPQVAKIHSQRADAGDDENRFKGNHNLREEAPPMLHTASKEETNDFSRYGSPSEEKGDPMNILGLPPFKTQRESSTGDVGELLHSQLPPLFEESSSNSELDVEARAGLKYTQSKDESVAGTTINEDYDDSDYELVNRWSLIRARYREPLAEGLAVSSFSDSYLQLLTILHRPLSTCWSCCVPTSPSSYQVTQLDTSQPTGPAAWELCSVSTSLVVYLELISILPFPLCFVSSVASRCEKLPYISLHSALELSSQPLLRTAFTATPSWLSTAAH